MAENIYILNLYAISLCLSLSLLIFHPCIYCLVLIMSVLYLSVLCGS